MILEKKEIYSILYSYYKELLSDKQRLYFELYYNDDYSLSEIASIYNITRNAIYDSISSTITELDKYENKLRLYELSNKRNTLYDKVNKDNYQEVINKLKELEND